MSESNTVNHSSILSINVEQIWIGIDTGAKLSAICAIAKDGHIIKEANIRTNGSDVSAFIDSISNDSDIKIALEACSTSISLAKSLIEQGRKVFIYDSGQIKKFSSIKRNKTDKNDARAIAKICQLNQGFIHEVYLKSNETYALRIKIISRNNLVNTRTSLENHIKSIFRIYGRSLGPKTVSSSIFIGRLHEEIKYLPQGETERVDEDIIALALISTSIRHRIKEIDKQLNTAVRNSIPLQNLVTVPGVRAITAISFFTAIGDHARFKKAKDVAAYLGLSPKVHASGASDYSRRITKAGSNLTRRHLVNAASVILNKVQNDSDLRTWGLSKKSSIGFSKAKVAVARKLAMIMYCVLRDGVEFNAHLFSQIAKTPRGIFEKNSVQIDGA